MNEKKHKLRHIQLHQALDELFADYIRHNPDEESYYTEMPVKKLIDWSYEQTIKPDE